MHMRICACTCVVLQGTLQTVGRRQESSPSSYRTLDKSHDQSGAQSGRE